MFRFLRLTLTMSALLMVLILSSSMNAAQKLDVNIIDRQNNSGSYIYVVPGYSNSSSNTNVNCTAITNNVNCISLTTTTDVNTPGLVGSYQVTGATLSLQLPDGRIAVVNCESKLNWTEWSKPTPYRSCRVPLVSGIQAEFDGDKAKLIWSVSLDGKKKESETYKILAVLAKP
jgi:hypothetical protein